MSEDTINCPVCAPKPTNGESRCARADGSRCESLTKSGTFAGGRSRPDYIFLDPGEFSMAQTKNVFPQHWIAVSVSALAIAMLLWALFERPPYVYFTALRIVVSGGAIYAAYFCWKQSRYFAPISLALIAIGAVQLFAKMHRRDWEPFNWFGELKGSASFVFTTQAFLVHPKQSTCSRFPKIMTLTPLISLL
jgi:hypothetical protein